MRPFQRCPASVSLFATIVNAFSGLPETMTDGRGVVTEYIWNEGKQQLKQKIVHGATNGREQVTVDYIYDGLDRLSNVVKNVSGLGDIWSETYAYDERSRIGTVDTTVANIPGQTADLEYTVEYDYGNRGYVTNRTVSVGGSQSSATAYTYEPDSVPEKTVCGEVRNAVAALGDENGESLHCHHERRGWGGARPKSESRDFLTYFRKIILQLEYTKTNPRRIRLKIKGESAENTEKDVGQRG